VLFQDLSQAIVWQCDDRVVINAGHGFGSHHRIDDRFLCGLDGRQENGIEGIVGQHRNLMESLGTTAPGFAVENAMKMSPEPSPE
jgi:hypothetical protein